MSLPEIISIDSIVTNDKQADIQFHQNGASLFSTYEVMDGSLTLMTVASVTLVESNVVKIKVTKLINKQAYYFKIRAINNDDQASEWFIISNPVIPSKKLAAPSILSIVRNRETQKAEITLDMNYDHVNSFEPTEVEIAYVLADGSTVNVPYQMRLDMSGSIIN